MNNCFISQRSRLIPNRNDNARLCLFADNIARNRIRSLYINARVIHQPFAYLLIQKINRPGMQLRVEIFDARNPVGPAHLFASVLDNGHWHIPAAIL